MLLNQGFQELKVNIFHALLRVIRIYCKGLEIPLLGNKYMDKKEFIEYSKSTNKW